MKFSLATMLTVLAAFTSATSTGQNEQDKNSARALESYISAIARSVPVPEGGHYEMRGRNVLTGVDAGGRVTGERAVAGDKAAAVRRRLGTTAARSSLEAELAAREEVWCADYDCDVDEDCWGYISPYNYQCRTCNAGTKRCDPW